MGKYMIIFGGKGWDGKVLGDTWGWDIEKERFFQVPSSFPGEKRKGHSAVAYSDSDGDHMVVFGGRHNSKRYYNDVWQLSRKRSGKWEWKKLADNDPHADTNQAKPTPRNHHTAVYYQGDMIVYGGRSDHSLYKNHEGIWRFSLTTLTWKRVDTANKMIRPDSRMEHCSDTYFEDMIVFAGQGSNGLRRNDIWKFSLRTNQWKILEANDCHQYSEAQTATIIGISVLLLSIVLCLYRSYLNSRSGYTRIY
mmetsp:Transcript_1270/g.1378  ORF Transcript_1270/g.1378 Transcript_1270/m.1378 type:complete len:250 (-) Transcript_1270:1256-2005(-)